jgi:quercetin dioxygenase-like cupin family protein
MLVTVTSYISERKLSMSTFMLSPAAGRLVWLGGLGVHFKLYGQETGGAFSIVEHPIEPGTLVTPHVHQHEDEFSYVLEGEIGARVGDQEILATPGCYIIKPRGIPHAFWNAGAQPARLLEIISPAGFEQYFLELSGALRSDGTADREKIEQLASQYGLTYEMNWIPDLVRRYHLKPPSSQASDQDS